MASFSLRFRTQTCTPHLSASHLTKNHISLPHTSHAKLRSAFRLYGGAEHGGPSRRGSTTIPSSPSLCPRPTVPSSPSLCQQPPYLRHPHASITSIKKEKLCLHVVLYEWMSLMISKLCLHHVVLKALDHLNELLKALDHLAVLLLGRREVLNGGVKRRRCGEWVFVGGGCGWRVLVPRRMEVSTDLGAGRISERLCERLPHGLEEARRPGPLVVLALRHLVCTARTGSRAGLRRGDFGGGPSVERLEDVVRLHHLARRRCEGRQERKGKVRRCEGRGVVMMLCVGGDCDAVCCRCCVD